MEKSFSDECTINISAETLIAGINGSGYEFNMNINIEERDTDFCLMLRNITVRAHSDKYAIEMQGDNNLFLYTYNLVVIRGCTLSSGDGVAAISCTQLIIEEANNLQIIGGRGADGVDATRGGNGGDGAPGVIVDKDVHIYCSNVRIEGGTPGKGGSGDYRGYGGRGAYAVAGRSEQVTVYILEGVSNVNLIDSEDGEDGEGLIGSVTGSWRDDVYFPPVERGKRVDPGIGGGIPGPKPPLPPIQIA